VTPLTAVIAALFLLTGWLVGAIWYPLWSQLAQRRPSVARFALPAAALPLMVAGSMVAAALVPGDPHLGTSLDCHCDSSAPAWWHLCLLHPADASPALPLALVLIVLLLPGRLRAAWSALRVPVGPGPRRGLQIQDLGKPTAVVAGWLRPVVVFDRGLWSELSPAQRDAVAAHEQAHIERSDPLSLAMLRLLSALAPPASRKRLIELWLLRAELQADRMAAESVDDPLTVADALLRCARLQPPAPLALSWNGGRVERRVQALLEPSAVPADRGGDLRWSHLAGLSILGLALLGSAPWLHHQVEHLLNLSF
jgi:Zn-dependent protease with chaperone function